MKRYYGSIIKRGSFYHWRFRNVDGLFTSRVVKNDAGGKVTNYAEAEKIVISWSSEFSSLQQLKTKEETLLKIAEVKTLLKVCRVPLAELEETFFNHPSAPTISPKHRKTYHSVLNMLTNFASQIQVETVADVTEEVAQSFLSYYWSRGISPKTYNSVLDILRCVFRLMNKDRNPFDGFKKKVCHMEERVAFTVEQLQKIWDTLTSPTYHMLHKEEMIVLYKLALYTGARCGDLCLLRWSSVDMQNRVIRFMPHKTAHSSHKTVEIPIGTVLYEALSSLDQNADYVLPNVAYRYQHNSGGISRDTKKLLLAAGLKPNDAGTTRRVLAVSRMGFHAFRHTAASIAQEISRYDDQVFEPVQTNSQNLPAIITRFVKQYAQNIDLSRWAFSRYMPTPTIIQAASSLYLNHSVSEITRTEASGENLQRTSEFVMNVIEHSRTNGEKSICFVTGVPGAGKTLVGLNIAVRQFEKKDLAVYLSGNQPLVSVLSEALARDKKRQEEERNPGTRYNLTDARRNVKSFIQIVHHYRDNTLNKLKTPIRNGVLEIDPAKVDKHKDDGYSEVEHVAIFDEAQRAWTKLHLANWLSRKKGFVDFPMSEPEFLIWSLNLREDWAVIVCLVGGGQEINTGEAGIGEWLRAVNDRFPDWNVFISDQLTGKEYAEGELEVLLQANKHVARSHELHLAVSMRSFRAEQLSSFVHHLLEGNVAESQRLLATLKDKYPIVLTRDLDAAKDWLRKQARGTERYGMVVSSQAQRLRPLAIDVRCKPDTVHWFLDDITDIRSSQFLEDAASEFDVQGLELDWTCLVWDGDLRRDKGAWQNFEFKGNKWLTIRAEERKTYQINAYRVLLTRARQGMVICVPEGNLDDATRLPAFYDGTYQYLKQIGLEEIGPQHIQK